VKKKYVTREGDETDKKRITRKGKKRKEVGEEAGVVGARARPWRRLRNFLSRQIKREEKRSHRGRTRGGTFRSAVTADHYTKKKKGGAKKAKNKPQQKRRESQPKGVYKRKST